ncbi:hypothetical protein SEA_WIPEOUT_278 [Streptomyces phage Wipeout]|nr:hypothetical protein SEA_WIPEOUT_24 [Streptomyces phage Wipeout]QGH74485.1 hypothetical protein SEA_WIPEOUT_278 [Streptomyces phage Wipeout]QGH78913.1 hypothetical protein SEA_TOMSAWYER_25 [Streptomyces phage TomSawyer]QGH79133.1 hypothetical protein SEA_TOMSAWYER_290 [Streptomyces phage TomSawyer]
MFKKKAKAVRTHSLTLKLEKNGLFSETGVISSGNLEILLRKYNEGGFRPVEAKHSVYCLCGTGKGETYVC